jgi:hypothetical protein
VDHKNINLFDSVYGSVTCHCNESLDFIKGWEILERMSDCWLLKQDSVDRFS